ncbi:MAG: hypothetical protein ACP5IG_00285 [Candidatus Micrarchaeia archaeon]
MDWIFFALASMLFVAVANVFLKQIMVSPNPLDAANIPLLVPFVVAGALAFAFFLLALRSPQSSVSVVSAIVSLSFVLVAIIAAVFLGEKLGAKEVSALFLAAVAVLVLLA